MVSQQGATKLIAGPPSIAASARESCAVTISASLSTVASTTTATMTMTTTTTTATTMVGGGGGEGGAASGGAGPAVMTAYSHRSLMSMGGEMATQYGTATIPNAHVPAAKVRESFCIMFKVA